MTERSPKDILQPCLLERLLDENPESAVETRASRVVSLARYREGVLRDLRWLLNSKCHREDDGLDEFPEAERSVINFGVPDPAGHISDAVRIAAIEQQIAHAIRRFEPRILPDTLQVHAIEAERTAQSTPNAIGFEIQGQLWAMPLLEPFFLKTEVNLETGQCTF